MRKRSAPTVLTSSRGRLVKPKLWHDGTKLCGYGLDVACSRSAMHSERCKLALAADQDGCAPLSRLEPLRTPYNSDTALHSPSVPVNPWATLIGVGLCTGPSGWEGGAACWCATAAAGLPVRGRKRRPSVHRCVRCCATAAAGNGSVLWALWL